MLAMVLYPGTMRKAQAEIDRTVGRDRLPTFADEANLPYVRALVKELMRWRTVDPVGKLLDNTSASPLNFLPIGVPRRSVQDDWYEGYFIPKGASPRLTFIVILLTSIFGRINHTVQCMVSDWKLSSVARG